MFFFSFSHHSGINEKCLQQNIVTESKLTDSQGKSEVLYRALDVESTEADCSGKLELADAQCIVNVCTCKAFDGSSNSSAYGNNGNLNSRGKPVDFEAKVEDQAIHSSDEVPLCCSCQAIEQQRLLHSVQSRSSEVVDDFGVSVDRRQYENHSPTFRNSLQVAGGNDLDVDESESKGDTEEVESQSPSLTSVTAVWSRVMNPVGGITCSTSVDTALGQTAPVCTCYDVDMISYRLQSNLVELESTTENQVGESDAAGRCFRKSCGAKIVSNEAAHCSRRHGEISFLNEELLKYCDRTESQCKPRSVSMPIDITTTRHLPRDQQIGNSLASDVDTTAAGRGQDLQPRQSVLLAAAETKVMRKRAYRVGLNLFNR